MRDPIGERLEDFIISWNLIDIKLKKGKFTWNNNIVGPGHIAARLDRFLVSSSFPNKPLLPVSSIMSSTTSNHRPISILFSEIENLGPMAFVLTQFG